jgi:hypothetical protein
MKTNIIAFSGIGLLVLLALAFASIFEIRLASAQVDATSSPPIDSTTTLPTLQASTSSTPIEDAASSTPATMPPNESASTTVATSSPSTSAPTMEPPPQGLTLVHIVGTKYTDYFTDGTSTVSFPGDPAIDSHFSEPNAPIPTHEGLTWVHTTGGYLYNTPSGDLEVGDYAVQPDNSYIENAPPFVSSTSTPAQIATSTSSTLTDTSSTTSNVAPTSVPDASTSTVPSRSDNSSSTTTSSEPIPPTL